MTDTRDAAPLSPEERERLKMLAERADDINARDFSPYFYAGMLSTAVPALLSQVERLERRAERAEAFLEQSGYRRCDIAACNCGSWHGGHAPDRLREISDTLAEAGIPGGTTIHGGVLMLRERAERLERERDEARAQFDRHVAWASDQSAATEQRIAALERERDEARAETLECSACGFGTNRIEETHCPNDGTRLAVTTWKDKALSAVAALAEMKSRDAQWAVKWQRALDTGIANTLREAQRAEAAERKIGALEAHVREWRKWLPDSDACVDDVLAASIALVPAPPEAERPAFVFSCPTCGQPDAQTRELDVDIHSGATYTCDQCGSKVIFSAQTTAEYVKAARPDVPTGEEPR